MSFELTSNLAVLLFSRTSTPPQECPSPSASPHPGSGDSECEEEGATVSDQLHWAWEGGHTPLPPGKTEVPVLQQCTLDPQPEKGGEYFYHLWLWWEKINIISFPLLWCF